MSSYWPRLRLTYGSRRSYFDTRTDDQNNLESTSLDDGRSPIVDTFADTGSGTKDIGMSQRPQSTGDLQHSHKGFESRPFSTPVPQQSEFSNSVRGLELGAGHGRDMSMEMKQHWQGLEDHLGGSRSKTQFVERSRHKTKWANYRPAATQRFRRDTQQYMRMDPSRALSRFPSNTGLKFQDVKQKLASSQEKVCELKQEIESKQQELHRCKTKLNKLLLVSGEPKILQKQLAETQCDLAACKDDLFRLQPVSQISDSEIANDFEMINQHIIKWVDMRIDELEEAHPDMPTERLFSTGTNMKAADFVMEYPRAGEFYARHLIHQQLYKTIFISGLEIFGLSEREVSLWEAVLDSVHELVPPRDPVMIRAWKAETLLALSTTTLLNKKRERKVNESMESIMHELQEAFPVLFDRSESLNRLYHDIVVPASQLTIKMKTSTSTYAMFIQEDWGRDFNVVARRAHIESHKLVDIDTSKALHADSPVTFVERNCLGDVLIQLEPKVIRLDENMPNTVLQRETDLVKLYHPLGKRKS